MKIMTKILTLICLSQLACTQPFKPASVANSSSSQGAAADNHGSQPAGDNPATTPVVVTPPAPLPIPATGPACAMPQSAFCDTFDQGPQAFRGRGGDLDASKWTAARLAPSDMTGAGPVANPVRIAPLPACRASLGLIQGYPPNDTLICDPDARGNRQLMTVVSAQNYGVNSYMIQQPFDFLGRTGKIVFNVDAVNTSGLGAFAGVEITEDPVQAPTFQHFHNFEVGPIPRNAVMIKLNDNCQSNGTNIRPGEIVTYNDYVMTIHTPSFAIASGACPTAKKGFLNHFEIQLSQTKIEIYSSDFSNDGVSFPNLRLVYSANINLNFSRAYVRIVARNHATLKYEGIPTGVFHWDNVGFDGPIISGNKFYGVPDNTHLSTYSFYGGDTVMNLGYMLRDGSNGIPAGMYNPESKIAPFQLMNVDTTGSNSARISLSAAFSPLGTITTAWGIQYRFNGGTWRTRTLTAREVQVITNQVNNDGGSAQNISLMMDVPMSDLHNGTNTLEFVSTGAPMDFAPVIANIDLILVK